MLLNNTVNRETLRSNDWSAQPNLRPDAAAKYLGLSTSTLAKLRMRNNRQRGPRFIKLGGCIVYRQVDLDDWIQTNAVDCQSL